MNSRISALLPFAVAVFLTFMMIGCAASDELLDEDMMPPAQDTVASAPAGPSRDELQQELDVLKTENIQMKEKLSAAEKTNRDLLSKASDLEASIAARAQSAKAAEASPAKRSLEGVTSPEDMRVYESAVAAVKANRFQEAVPK